MTLETNELKDNQIEQLNKQIMQIKIQKENFQNELEITNLNLSDAKNKIKDKENIVSETKIQLNEYIKDNLKLADELKIS